MATNFPSSLDSLSNPTASDSEVSVSHSGQHANANDAIEALEAKVGADSSIVTTSHDYKLSEVTSSDKAVGKTATQTLANKTLTSPVINTGSDATGDMYYRNSGGIFTRLAIGSADQVMTVAGGVPTWQNNAATQDASTTQQGVVEEADQTETDNGTAAGTAARLYVNPSTLRAKKYNDYAADAVGTDAYAITISPAISAYAAGQEFTFKAGTANTGPATLNVNGQGAVTIKRNKDQDLVTGDILANQIVKVVYDGTNMQMLSDLPIFYDAGIISDLNTTSAANNDVTVTTNFAPRIIKLHFWIQGYYSISTSFFGSKGTAVYDKTGTLKFATYEWGQNGAGAVAGMNADNGYFDVLSEGPTLTDFLGSTAPTAGTNVGGNSIAVTLTIPTVSTTGFTIRRATTIAGTPSNPARARIAWEAYA